MTGLPDADFAALLASLRDGGNTAVQAPAAPVEPQDDVPLGESTAAMIQRVVRTAETGSARSQQRVIGLSEIGDPCDRAVAYRLFETEPVNTGRDNWLATLGTAGHAWLADAFEAENRRLGRERYVVEQRVWLTDGYSGTCDLFDSDTGTVLDHKVLGVTSLRKIRAGEIPPKYRLQIHAYGYGHARAGREVREVALVCYPRSDNLAGDFGGQGLHVWSEPYSEQVALEGLDRLSNLTVLAGQLDVETHPERWALIPATPGSDCRYCPFFRPDGGPADAIGCPGAPVTVPTSMPGIV